MANPKGTLPPQLARANALRGLLAAGYTNAQANAMLAGPGAAKRGPGRPRKDRSYSGGGEVQPMPGGDGVRPPGRQGALYAKIAASPEIQFDQRALASIWEGVFSALRTAGQYDPASLFPDLYPCSWQDQDMAQEREIGREMAKLLPVALAALGVTVEEWSAWYASRALVRLQSGPAVQGCGPAAAPMMQQASNGGPTPVSSGWGAMTGAPLLGPGRQ